MKTVHSSYLASFYEICIQNGALETDLLPLIDGGLKAVHNPNIRFPIECVLNILATTEKTTGRRDIGLVAGTNFRPSTFQDIGHAFMFCRSLRHVLLINRRYQPITQQFGRSNLKIIDDQAWLIWESYDQNPETCRNITDAVMAGHAKFGRWLSWANHKKINAMYFRHAKPDYALVYENIFECPIYFSQQNDAMVVDIESIDTPLPQANEDMLYSVCKTLDAALEALQKPQSCSDKLAEYIGKNLGNGAPNLNAAAIQLGVSPRSLRRRLAQEDTSYRIILESVRQTKCEQYMLEGNLALAKIAERLGYSEQSAFNRAFKSWQGKTPQAYAQAIKQFNTAFGQLPM